MHLPSLSLTFLLATKVAAYDNLLHFGPTAQVETRSINQIYKAALKEGGVVTAWFGGDEKNQNDAVKNAFESAFPGMKLNLTTDLSKYLDGKIDQQLASNNVYVDTLALQTTQDFPRWKEEGALLYYAPAGFDKIYSGLKDADAAYYGFTGIAWQLIWNADKLKGKKVPAEYSDFLAPEYKGKLALTYPNDDDSILFLFDKILNHIGPDNWPWILNATYPKKSNFISWAQHTAILKDAPHPEGAKLLQNFLLSKEFQKTSGFWPVRSDVAPPVGFPGFVDQAHTDPHDFMNFMVDRQKVERLRFWFEKRLGTAQGLSPLDDDFIICQNISSSKCSSKCLPLYSQQARDVAARCIGDKPRNVGPVLAYADRDSAQLPSWVPDWTLASRAVPLADSWVPGVYSAIIRKSDIFAFQDLSHIGLSSANIPLLDATSFTSMIKDHKLGEASFTAFWHTLVAGKNDFADIFSLLLEETTGISKTLPGQKDSVQKIRSKGQRRLELANLSRRKPGATFQEIRNGRFALFPSRARGGDDMYVLEHCNVPYAIVPAKENSLRFVGECYVYGIMQGEALKGKFAPAALPSPPMQSVHSSRAQSQSFKAIYHLTNFQPMATLLQPWLCLVSEKHQHERLPLLGKSWWFCSVICGGYSRIHSNQTEAAFDQKVGGHKALHRIHLTHRLVVAHCLQDHLHGTMYFVLYLFRPIRKGITSIAHDSFRNVAPEGTCPRTARKQCISTIDPSSIENPCTPQCSYCLPFTVFG
ncbi:Uncharacterized protein LW93_11148 [Fusarium fujikuroi]|nr:Uncharacterized protein LW93_11148 [Fusarium fujikuroi]